jgi:hypothetical protein
MGVNCKKIEGSGGRVSMLYRRSQAAKYGSSKSKKGIPSPFVGGTRHSRIGNGWPNIEQNIRLGEIFPTYSARCDRPIAVKWGSNWSMTVRGPPNANFLSTSGFLLHPQSRQREPPQTPPHEVVELQQPDITTDGEHDLRVGSAAS